MENFELNDVPELLQNPAYSQHDILNEIAAFVLKNKVLFDLHKFDEDFVSEVLMTILERGHNVLEEYNPDLGSFFNYFFYYIKHLIKGKLRTKARQIVIENHNYTESVFSFSVKCDAYRRINYQDLERPVIPYTFKRISAEDFAIACKSKDYKICEYKKNDDKEEYMNRLNDKLKRFTPVMKKRIFIILALKCAYYITDEQISLISELCNLDKIKFQDAIQYVKSLLEQRENNKKEFELRRNRAYFHHKTYRLLLREYFNEDKYIYDEIEEKYEHQTKNWETLNVKLKKGLINIRPTTKLISEILGISERQVNYYQQNAKLLGIELQE